MDLRAKLAQSVFVPLYERRWGIHDPGLRRSLARSQYDSPEQIRERQWNGVRAMVAHAHAANPFYRERFRSIGLQPEDLRTWEDFGAIPLLTKDDIRNHPDALISDGFSRDTMVHMRTGGSTGVPVHLYWDAYAHRFKNALVRRHDAWAGFVQGIKQAALWGDTDKHYPLKVRLYKALCERTLYLDTLKMDDAYLAQFVERVRKFRPRVLIGHAHSLYFFAEFLLARKIADVRFEAIISTAETLIPAERETIESCFGPVLFNRYGCEELSLIASECEQHDGMHVGAEGLIVEVLDGDATTPGRVVVTDLVNRGMPFLRYEVGDLATTAPAACACGRGLPRLGRVFGRTSDILYAPDGRKISGISILDTFVIHVAGVKQAQIVQDALDHLRVRVVPDARYTEDTERALAASVRQIFGAQMRHDLELVDAIAPTARGKYQFSICEIDAPGAAQQVADADGTRPS